MSNYRPMQDADNDADIANYAQWDAQRLGVFFRRQGLMSNDYQEMLVKHKITGQLAPLLQDDDLKEMGMTIVGDRLRLKRSLKELSRRERYHKRIAALWQGEERLFFSSCHQQCWTVGGLCPVDPSTYKLTTNHLKVKRVLPARCGPIPLTCCFGATYTSNNIDLSKVDDVDVVRS